MARRLFTSESVTEGHPDKMADQISDTILDAMLKGDPQSRVAVETLITTGQVHVAGEVTTTTYVDIPGLIRDKILEIGYDSSAKGYDGASCGVSVSIGSQSPDIAQGVLHAFEHREGEGEDELDRQGAGDQGLMFGFACRETPELMPLPILLAHRLARQLAEDRRAGAVNWLRPDGKSQVSVVYENNQPKYVSDVLVSTQHFEGISQSEIRQYVIESLAPRALGSWFAPEIRYLVNPTGSFSHGGPSADCGVTGRKIIVDSYGGMAPHGGGAFSGKDPSKVDRSGAYYCRYVAREIVKSGLAHKAQVQVAYAIGVAKPVSVKVETFGTGDDNAAVDFVNKFDFRPAAIIEQLDLLRPIYRQTTNYGHFGRPGLPWEK